VRIALFTKDIFTLRQMKLISLSLPTYLHIFHVLFLFRELL